MDNLTKKLSDFHDDNGFYYASDDIIFANSLANLPDGMIETYLDFEMMVYCRKGKFQIKTENYFYTESHLYNVEAGQGFMFSDDYIIHDFIASADADIAIVGYSWNYIEATDSINTVLWPFVDYVIENSVIPFDAPRRRVLELYIERLAEVWRSDNTVLKDNLMQTLARALLYEFIRMISAEMRSLGPHELGRSGEISRLFFDILAAKRGQIRSVADVAEMMCISPKYLSRVIKEENGKKPMFYIHQYMMKTIENELKYTTKSIKEIAYQLHFPSLAFFGKFVKQHTGYSPKAYREMLKERD
jgi:AraC-like DNA-binding protein